MATITTTARAFFRNGASTTSNLLGYTSSDKVVYVTRYTLSTEDLPSGASSIQVELPSVLDTTTDCGLVGSLTKYRFKVTTSATSHVNAGPTTTDYDGEVTFVAKNGTYYLTIPKTTVVLLPNTTYYLYLFPAEAVHGYFYNRRKSLDIIATGGAGIVEIYNGSKWESYQCYIYNGSKWEMYLPYVYNGSGWDLC